MAKVTDQSIPSELRDLYERQLQVETDTRGVKYVRARFPWRLPHMKEEGPKVQPSQEEVRDTFKRCAACFGWQPDAGGATPPDVGPRNRDWWWTAAIESGQWYYNYFMQQSLNSYFGDVVPDWCKTGVSEDSYVYSASPYSNYGSSSTLQVRKPSAFDIRTFIQFPVAGIPSGASLYLGLYCRYAMSYYMEQYKTFIIDVHKVTEAWSQGTITWNNKPDIGAIISSKSLSFDFGSPPTSFIYPNEWQGFTLPNAAGLTNGVCLILREQTETVSIEWWSKNYWDTTKRPIVST